MLNNIKKGLQSVKKRSRVVDESRQGGVAADVYCSLVLYSVPGVFVRRISSVNYAACVQQK